MVVGFQAVANHLVVMPLQQHARAGHRRVGGIEGVGFDVAVVAQLIGRRTGCCAAAVRLTPSIATQSAATCTRCAYSPSALL